MCVGSFGYTCRMRPSCASDDVPAPFVPRPRWPCRSHAPGSLADFSRNAACRLSLPERPQRAWSYFVCAGEPAHGIAHVGAAQGALARAQWRPQRSAPRRASGGLRAVGRRPTGGARGVGMSGQKGGSPTPSRRRSSRVVRSYAPGASTGGTSRRRDGRPPSALALAARAVSSASRGQSDTAAPPSPAAGQPGPYGRPGARRSARSRADPSNAPTTMRGVRRGLLSARPALGLQLVALAALRAWWVVS